MKINSALGIGTWDLGYFYTRAKITVLRLIFILMAAGTLSLLAACQNNDSRAEESAQPSVNIQRLSGRWLRPDGGYILEVRRIHTDGKVEAVYLNPRPINVAEARVEETQGRLRLRVVLRDEGYPGSYYELDYDQDHDQLTGNYYQATMGAVFDVHFVRLPE